VYSRDKLVYSSDVRAAIMLVPNHPNLHHIKEFTSWRPEGVKILPRFDDE
jgi:hypothetical protein